MNTVTIAYGKMLSEQGVWADGCSVLTCGGTTGHFVGAIAFCDKPETAAVLADAVKQAGHAAALLEALEMMRDFGCPVCSGDCGSANPPVVNCPMQVVCAAIALARGAK